MAPDRQILSPFEFFVFFVVFVLNRGRPSARPLWRGNEDRLATPTGRLNE